MTGLTPATTYYFALKSTDEAGLSSVMSNRATATSMTLDVTPPAAVADLSASNIGTDRLTLHWTASGDDGTTGTASGYDIRFSTSPIANNASFTTAAAATQTPVMVPKAAGQAEGFTVTGLTPGTTYTWP